MAIPEAQKDYCSNISTDKLEIWERQAQELVPVDAKMRHMGQKLQSLRDKKLERRKDTSSKRKVGMKCCSKQSWSVEKNGKILRRKW